MGFNGDHIPRPSLMERLRDDPADDDRADWFETDPVSIKKARSAAERALIADLEKLLNARRPFVSLPKRFADIELTVVGYGLPDVALIGVDDVARRAGFLRDLKSAVAAFEPRLSDVRLEQALGDSRGRSGRLCIRVTAMFAMDGGPSPICFETVMSDGDERVKVELDEGSA